jgi:hypothetical protein
MADRNTKNRKEASEARNRDELRKVRNNAQARGYFSCTEEYVETEGLSPL